MRFFIDECIPNSVIEALERAGYELVLARETCFGCTDEEILHLANAEKCILMTEDKDFGELVFRARLVSSGIVILHLPSMPSSRQAMHVIKALHHLPHPLAGHLTIIENQRLRQRPLT